MITLLVLLAAVLVAASFVLRRRRAQAALDHVHVYEMTSAGSLPADAAEARPLASDVTDTVLGASSRFRPARLCVVRTFEDGVTRSFLVVSGIESAQTRSIVLATLRRGLSLELLEVESLRLPSAPVLTSSVRGRREGREKMGSLVAWSEQVAATFEAGREPAFLAVGFEPLTQGGVKAWRAHLASVLEADGETAATHPQFSSGKLMGARLLAGTQSAEAGQALVSASANYLPGFDFAVEAEVVSDVRLGGGALAGGLLLALATFGSAPLWVTVLVAAAAVALSVPLLTSRWDVLARPLRDHVALGVVDVAAPGLLRSLDVPRRTGKLVRHTAAWFLSRWSGLLDAKGKRGAAARRAALSSRLREARTPSDPRPRTSLVLAPEQTAALLVPPTTKVASAAGSGILQVPAPAQVRSAKGIVLGVDPEGCDVILPDHDRRYGLFGLGDPGVGKTRLLTQVFAEDVRAARPGWTLLGLDVKGDGKVAGEYERIARHLGSAPVRLDVAASTGPMLRLLDPERPKHSAEQFVDALAYALADGAVADHSRGVFVTVFSLGLHAARVTGEVDPVSTAWILLDGDTPHRREEVLGHLRRSLVPVKPATVPAPAAAAAVAAAPAPAPVGGDLDMDDLLFGTIPAAAPAPAAEAEDGAAAELVLPAGVDEDSVDLLEALRVYDNYPKSVKDRDVFFRAPRNKVQKLLATPHVWRTGERPALSMRDVVSSGGVVVVNFGAGPAGEVLTEEKASLLASIFVYLLWAEVKASCSGWLGQGRAVVLYCDELSNIAGGTDGDGVVIADLRDKGRDLGLAPVFATQRAEQLPRRAAEAMGTVNNRVFLRLSHPKVAAEALTQLVGEATDSFALDDLMNLDPGHALVKLSVDGRPVRRAFSLTIADVYDRIGLPPPL